MQGKLDKLFATFLAVSSTKCF